MSGSTLRDLYTGACSLLESRFEATQIFEHITNMRVHELVQKGHLTAAPDTANALLELCAQRRAGVPLQYLLGEWEFYGLPFKVGRGVLIPRADTETLVDAACEILKDTPAPAILDLCAGSGCIAIALGHIFPAAQVTAVEKSPHAMQYLRENIRLNHSQVQAVQADLNDYDPPNPLDLIVSNPPYIPSGDITGLMPELHYEPHGALDGGADGLDFYKIIASRCHAQLKPGGWLCFELGIGQAMPVRQILKQNGYHRIRTRDDLSGITRVICACKDS